MNEDDRNYYEARAREERSLANVCADNAAALVHLAMAAEYERRIHNADGFHEHVPPRGLRQDIGYRLFAVPLIRN